MKELLNSTQSLQGGNSTREENITHLYQMFEFIDNLNLIFQEISCTEFCGDEIELAEEMGFIDIFSRTELLYFLAKFKSSRTQASIVTAGDVSSKMEEVDVGLVVSRRYVGPEALSGRAYDRHKKAIQFCNTYQQSGKIEDLENAIEAFRGVLSTISIDDPGRTVTLGNLGSCLGLRYCRLKDPKDFENAIDILTEVVATIPKDSAERQQFSANLVTQLSLKDDYQETYDSLDWAIEAIEDAIEATPALPSGPPPALAFLASQLYLRSLLRGNPEDLEKAISVYRSTVDTNPMNSPIRGENLNPLSVSLSMRYELSGNLEALEDAIKFAEEALKNPYLDMYIAIINLGHCLVKRYNRLGAYEDLDRAIKTHQDALYTVPTDHPIRIVLLCLISAYIMLRYMKLRSLQDLERAIELSREAVELTPPSSHTWQQVLATHAELLYTRYNRLQTPEDLDQAVEQAKQAVASTPLQSGARPKNLGSLAKYLHSRYTQSKRVEDLEQAIERVKEAIAATLPGNRNHPVYLYLLSDFLASRYDRLGTLEDLEEAIIRMKEAVAETPIDDPGRGSLLMNLTYFLYKRTPFIREMEGFGVENRDITSLDGLTSESFDPIPYDLDRLLVAEDLRYLLNINIEIWLCTKSQPILRVTAARSASFYIFSLASAHRSSPLKQIGPYLDGGSILVSDMDHHQFASSLLDAAVKLLPQISPRFLGRDDQQAELKACVGIASSAAAMASLVGKEPTHCLELLELGRGIIQGLSIDCRSDVSDLQAQRPDLASKFNLLRIEIDSPPPQYDDVTYESNHDRRIHAIRELEEILVSIRKLPNFEGFLLPPSSIYLLEMAQNGPIVTINCDPFLCEALIVSSTGIKALPLPGLVYRQGIDQMRAFQGSTQGNRSSYAKRNKVMRNFLLWLWDVIVEPVFTELQFHPIENGGNLPRVWWIGVGPLATAPFHAAGDHSPGSTRNTLSRAISSYTPTIKSLSYAREGKLELLRGQKSKLLMVTMPETPGHSALKATEEASKITNAIHETTHAVQINLLNRPGVHEVLDQLETFQAVHFASHGVPDAVNPSNSHLLLFKDDGSESGTVDKLTVGSISDRNMKNMGAQIAYLSACNTAANQSKDLQDESIHIASGFQLAGFSHVLATLWRSEDTACQNVAAGFYRRLFDGEGDNGHSKVSHSFHYAVKEIRERLWKQPIIWASFIHTGA